MTAPHFAMLALKIVVGWTLASFIVGAAVCWLITRGKMDSHRRDDRAGSDQALGLRGHGERSAEIDFPHGGSLPHAAE